MHGQIQELEVGAYRIILTNRGEFKMSCESGSVCIKQDQITVFDNPDLRFYFPMWCTMFGGPATWSNPIVTDQERRFFFTYLLESRLRISPILIDLQDKMVFPVRSKEPNRRGHHTVIENLTDQSTIRLRLQYPDGVNNQFLEHWLSLGSVVGQIGHISPFELSRLEQQNYSDGFVVQSGENKPAHTTPDPP